MAKKTSGYSSWWKRLATLGFAILVAILLALSLSALIYQADRPRRENGYHAQGLAELTASPPGITITISYPERLLLEDAGESGHPLSIWLTTWQPTTRTVTYTANLESGLNTFAFADKNGIPGSSRSDISIIPGSRTGDTTLWLLQRLPSDVARATYPSCPDRYDIPSLRALNWVVTRTCSHVEPALAIIFASKPISTNLTLRVMDASQQWVVLSPATPLTIEIESTLAARRRKLLDIALGPNTPQIGLIGILLMSTWGVWQKLDKDRRDREEKHRQRQQQFTDDIVAIEALWQTDADRALDGYLYLVEQVPPGDIELAARLERPWNSKWRGRVLDQAIEAFANRDDQRAKELAGLVKGDIVRKGNRKTRAGDLQVDQLEADYLLLLLHPSRKSTAQLDAIIGLADSRGSMLADRLVSLLLGLLANNNAERSRNIQCLIERETSSGLHWRWLLREQRVREHLEMLLDQQHLDNEGKSAAKALLLLIQEDYVWPALPRPKTQSRPSSGSDDQFARALEKLDWQRNPFVPNRVELDSSTRLDAYVNPPLWNDLISHQPFVFSTNAGFGQTSALWKAAREWQTNAHKRSDDSKAQALFPVFVDTSLLLAASTRSACYEAFSYDIAQAALRFFLWSPASFGAMPRAQQRAISRLISAQQQRLGDLGAFCRSAGLSTPPWQVSRLGRMIADASHNAKPCVLTNEADLLSLLSDSHMSDFDEYALIIDVSNRDLQRYSATTLVSRLTLVLDMIPDLTSARVILKAGIPGEVANPLAAHSPAPLMKWSHEELTLLLQERLLWSQQGKKTSGSIQKSLGQLFSPLIPNADNLIIVAAKGSPRRLVDLGNSMLGCLDRKSKDKLLTADDLESVISGSE